MKKKNESQYVWRLVLVGISDGRVSVRVKKQRREEAHSDLPSTSNNMMCTDVCQVLGMDHGVKLLHFFNWLSTNAVDCYYQK